MDREQQNTNQLSVYLVERSDMLFHIEKTPSVKTWYSEPFQPDRSSLINNHVRGARSVSCLPCT